MILLDIERPVLNGYEVLKQLKENPDTNEIPVIFLTSHTDPGSELEGLNLGAIDYVTKPFSAPILLKRLENNLLLVSQGKRLKRYNLNLKEMVDAQTREIKKLQNGIIDMVAEVVEFRNDMGSGHIERITSYMKVIVDALLEQRVYREDTINWDAVFLIPAAQLHDVGKICIGEVILNKPSRLTPEEFDEIKKHPAYGLMIIDRMEQTIGKHVFLSYAGVIAEAHHERWDGRGYPAGLKEKEVPLPARIMAIIDVYDALISPRPYKQPMSHSEAIDVIIQEKGKAFDPLLVDVLVAHADEFAHIGERRDILI
jgi:putative two-component system response regulator